MIRKFGGASGVENQVRGLDQGFFGNNIIKVQRGEFTWGTLATVNVTLSTPIDVNKSVISVCAYPNANAGIIESMATIVDSTTIQFTRVLTTSNSQPVYWQVVEYTNVKSKQTGTFTGTGALATVTVNSVNIDKSILVLSHKSTLAGTTYTSYVVAGKITSATVISLFGTLTSTTIHWQLLEFY